MALLAAIIIHHTDIQLFLMLHITNLYHRAYITDVINVFTLFNVFLFPNFFIFRNVTTAKYEYAKHPARNTLRECLSSDFYLLFVLFVDIKICIAIDKLLQEETDLANFVNVFI